VGVARAAVGAQLQALADVLGEQQLPGVAGVQQAQHAAQALLVRRQARPGVGVRRRRPGGDGGRIQGVLGAEGVEADPGAAVEQGPLVVERRRLLAEVAEVHPPRVDPGRLQDVQHARALAPPQGEVHGDGQPGGAVHGGGRPQGLDLVGVDRVAGADLPDDPRAHPAAARKARGRRRQQGRGQGRLRGLAQAGRVGRRPVPAAAGDDVHAAGGRDPAQAGRPGAEAEGGQLDQGAAPGGAEGVELGDAAQRVVQQQIGAADVRIGGERAAVGRGGIGVDQGEQVRALRRRRVPQGPQVAQQVLVGQHQSQIGRRHRAEHGGDRTRRAAPRRARPGGRRGAAHCTTMAPAKPASAWPRMVLRKA
jgi:hypothetical protein